MLDPGPLELAEADIVVERVHLPHQSPAQALRDWKADNITTRAGDGHSRSFKGLLQIVKASQTFVSRSNNNSCYSLMASPSLKARLARLSPASARMELRKWRRMLWRSALVRNLSASSMLTKFAPGSILSSLSSVRSLGLGRYIPC